MEATEMHLTLSVQSVCSSLFIKENTTVKKKIWSLWARLVQEEVAFTQRQAVQGWGGCSEARAAKALQNYSCLPRSDRGKG